MFISIGKAKEAVLAVLKVGLVPMLHGSPGTAKSALARQIADEASLELVDIRLSTVDPTDLNGFIFPNKETMKADYMPVATFPVERDPLPKGKKGWLLFLDEINSAPQAIQAAAYKLILDKKVGQLNLHKSVAIMAAGNLMSDKAIVNKSSTAMQSRMIHLQIQMEHKAWVEWAENNNIDHRVIAFINFRPELLHKFDPNHNDLTFPCARTHDFVSRLITPYPDALPEIMIPIIEGTIGEGAGREFTTFCEIYGDLITIDDILADPTGCKVPDEPATLYAIMGMIGSNTTVKNFETLYKYIERMDAEFEAVTMRGCCRRCPQITQSSSWKKATLKYAKEYM